MQGVKTVTKSKTKSRALVTDGIGNDLLKGSAFAVGAMAVGVLGVWAISSFVAGIVTAGGPLSLLTSWLNAVTGM